MDSTYPPPPLSPSSHAASLLSGLGQALRWLREKQSRKQYRVADTAGITKGMLSAYETGRQRPSLDTLDKLLDTLGCDLNDLHNALQIVNGRPELIKGWRGWQPLQSLQPLRSLEVRESAPPYGPPLEMAPGDLSPAGESQHRGGRPAIAEITEISETGAIRATDLYSVLGYDRPRLAAGEEQALGQMLDGFHNLLRYWHRSLVAIAPPAAGTGASGAAAGKPGAETSNPSIPSNPSNDNEARRRGDGP